MNLVILIPAAGEYGYALETQALYVQMAISEAGIGSGKVIIASDGSETATNGAKAYEKAIPEGWAVEHLIDKRLLSGQANYGRDAQLCIAQMRQMLASEARARGADYALWLDSDVLPRQNTFVVGFDVLNFDRGIYSAACFPYVSQGGGMMLGGRSVPGHAIAPNVYPDERENQVLVKRLQRLMEIANQQRAFPGMGRKDQTEAQKRRERRWADMPVEAFRNQMKKWGDRIENLPPRENPMVLQGKNWRRRGWCDYAYPGIGWGAIVPTDWFGFGCILMNRRALNCCDWTGYTGGGTEDIFAYETHFKGQGLRMGLATHAPAHHVVRPRDPKGGQHHNRYVLVRLDFVRDPSSEFVDHIRRNPTPYYKHTPGEKFDPANTGELALSAEEIAGLEIFKGEKPKRKVAKKKAVRRRRA